MLALAIVPGPSMILAFTEGVMIGVVKTVPTALGNLAAALLQATIALMMINGIAVISDGTQIIVQLLGALFIAYIGWSILRSKPATAIEADGGYHYQSSIIRFFNGFSISAFNPKSILFFAALFPQLVTAEHGYNIVDYMAFFLPIFLVGFGVFLSFSSIGQLTKNTFAGSTIFQKIPIITGGLLLAFSLLSLANIVTLLMQ